MTGWEVQALKESEDARIWEELNAPDPFERQMKSASISIKEAADFLNICTDRLVDAGCDLDETPMRNRIDSLCEVLEEYRCELKQLAEMYRKGVRE